MLMYSEMLPDGHSTAPIPPVSKQDSRHGDSFKEGFGIQGKLFQKSVGSQVNADYVSDTPLYSDDDIDTD